MKKKIFFVIGCLSLGLGGIGVFLPILPTTPFILLSAFLFERSSEKFHTFLLENKLFGKYLKNYTEKKGITLKNKVIGIAIVSLGMGRVFFSINNTYGKVTIIIIFLGVLVHLLKMKILKY